MPSGQIRRISMKEITSLSINACIQNEKFWTWTDAEDKPKDKPKKKRNPVHPQTCVKYHLALKKMSGLGPAMIKICRYKVKFQKKVQKKVFSQDYFVLSRVLWFFGKPNVFPPQWLKSAHSWKLIRLPISLSNLNRGWIYHFFLPSVI